MKAASARAVIVPWFEVASVGEAEVEEEAA
jgi:hypothetical protein